MSSGTHIIKLKTYGNGSIGARVVGVKIKNEVLELLTQSPDLNILFDFEDINYISTGFAKELFGELYKSMGNEFAKRISVKIDSNNTIIKEIILKGISSVS